MALVEGPALSAFGGEAALQLPLDLLGTAEREARKRRLLRQRQREGAQQHFAAVESPPREPTPERPIHRCARR